MSDSSTSDARGPLKSAYERALERLESQGIAAPDSGALSEAGRQAVAEAKRKAEAKRAELEILHRKELATAADPEERRRLEEEYALERRAIDEKLARDVERLRHDDRG